MNEMNGLKVALLAIIAALNIYAFIIYYIDKQRAINRKYRISEKSLLMTACALGGIGAWLGMKTFRHKTQHNIFRFGLPIAAIVTLIAILIVLI